MCGGVRVWVCQEHPLIVIAGEAGVVAGAASASAAWMSFEHWGFIR